jgi:predicted ABC-type ATPase
MKMDSFRELYIIGGPNGAGKTTSAMNLLAQYLSVYEFVNADEIARGLNPLNPESANFMAGRIMLSRVEKLLTGKASFALETTCAGFRHLETIKRAKSLGYRTNLLYLWLPSADMAVQRVKSRVEQGGHNIPEATILRRYEVGLRNMYDFFLPKVDSAVIYDNSGGETGEIRKIAEKNLEFFQIFDHAAWDAIKLFSRGQSHEPHFKR